MATESSFAFVDQLMPLTQNLHTASAQQLDQFAGLPKILAGGALVSGYAATQREVAIFDQRTGGIQRCDICQRPAAKQVSGPPIALPMCFTDIVRLAKADPGGSTWNMYFPGYVAIKTEVRQDRSLRPTTMVLHVTMERAAAPLYPPGAELLIRYRLDGSSTIGCIACGMPAVRQLSGPPVSAAFCREHLSFRLGAAMRNQDDTMYPGGWYPRRLTRELEQTPPHSLIWAVTLVKQ